MNNKRYLQLITNMAQYEMFDESEYDEEIERHFSSLIEKRRDELAILKPTTDNPVTKKWTLDEADFESKQIVPKKDDFGIQISGSTYREKKNNLKKHLIEYYIDKFQPPELSEVDKLFVVPSMKVVPIADLDYVFIKHIDTRTLETYTSIYDVDIFGENLDTYTEDTDTDSSHSCYNMQSTQIKKDVRIKINDVFFDAQKKKFYRICISGNAGQGKTTLCKMLCLAWCQAHLSEAYSGDHIPEDFIKVMQKFDILFYIESRKTFNSWFSTDMINELYFNDDYFFDLFMKNERDNSSVLVILDGVDMMGPFLPLGVCSNHFSSRMGGFTTLTTIQPQGLNVPSEFDRNIKLTGINVEASHKYVKNIVDILNQKNNVTKDSKIFIKQIEDKNLKHFLNIPILLKQLIVLWHNGEVEFMDRSQVHMYSAMINRFLMEVKKSQNNKASPGETNKEKNLPKCLEEKHFCKLYKGILLSLSHLAFTAVCTRQFTFDYAVAKLQNLADEDINACLSAGFLCQEDGKFSFLHKSFQDFLAAVFLVMYYQESLQFLSCLTTHEILYMRSLYIFACGMDSYVMALLLQQIRISFWENDMVRNKHNSQLLEQIQDLICECLRACENKTNPQLSFHTESISIVSEWKNSDWRWGYLNHLINENPCSIIILQVYIYTENPSDEFRKCLNLVLSKCRSIRHVRLVLWENPPEDIEAELEKAFSSSWSSPSLDVFGEVPHTLIPYINEESDDQHKISSNQLKRKGKVFPKKANLSDLLQKYYNDKSILSLISRHIESLSENILNVCACYEPGHEKNIIFLIIHDGEIEMDKQQKLNKYNVSYRNKNDVSKEKKEVFFRKVFNEEAITKVEYKNVKECIADNEEKLFEKHSNLTMILPNNVKSTGYGNIHKPRYGACIVLFVSVKGLIPVSEKEFPKMIGNYPTDVMEGTMSLFVQTAKDMHDDIKTGCQITSYIKKTGTVGPIIMLYDMCYGFITSAHVVGDNINTHIYQPDHLTASNPIGHVVDIIVSPKMEIAVVKLNSRWPRAGIFPESSVCVKENGFCSSNVSYSGEFCEDAGCVELWSKVYMFGSQSGATKGILKETSTTVNFRTLKLQEQLIISDLSLNIPFAKEGDSGSAVFVKKSNGALKILGILVGGGECDYIVTPIWNVRDKIKGELLQFKQYGNEIRFKENVANPMPGNALIETQICYQRNTQENDVEMEDSNN